MTAPRIAARTHVGLVRRRNEDTHYVGTHLVAVADGMGGHVSGDVASSTVIDTIRGWDRDVPVDLVGDTLGRAFGAANSAMRRRIASAPELAGMGTTLVALMWSGSTGALANLGDSRAYRLRAEVLERLTDDHVYGRLLANAGSVATLPERLSRYLDGRVEGRSADLIPLSLQPGDRILLCSDGLSSYVAKDQIRNALTGADLDEAADQLVALALEHGAPDNVTVIVIAV